MFRYQVGLNFKGKIIGVDNVTEARGDRMSQDAMQRLKAYIKGSGQHKTRIVVNISTEGIKIIDERTAEVLYDHPVHRISYISRDVTDARAFGYIYGPGDGTHQFFAIKTEKAAEAVVLTLKDLFTKVFEMKKKESEQANKKLPESPGKIKVTPGSNTGESQETSSTNNNLLDLDFLNESLMAMNTAGSWGGDSSQIAGPPGQQQKQAAGSSWATFDQSGAASRSADGSPVPPPLPPRTDDPFSTDPFFSNQGFSSPGNQGAQGAQQSTGQAQNPFGQPSQTFTPQTQVPQGFGQQQTAQAFGQQAFGQQSQMSWGQQGFGQKAPTQAPIGQTQHQQLPAQAAQQQFGQSPGQQQQAQVPQQPTQMPQQQAFGHQQPPQQPFSQSQAPQQAFGQSQAPQQAFGQSQAPQQAFGQSQAPLQAFGQSQAPQASQQAFMQASTQQTFGQQPVLTSNQTSAEPVAQGQGGPAAGGNPFSSSQNDPFFGNLLNNFNSGKPARPPPPKTTPAQAPVQNSVPVAQASPPAAANNMNSLLDF